ncbi:hypothetical protein HMPREF3187_01763 [Aerococcus christensenii]|uniref:Uncharacterized protein n=1 Tax=Aerococcus christensenii TaxID=87541 RepID=A0A133XQB5_9LACT|nr:hypothetical protein [Aerococcus christensenii]KXB33120.1 hypothetical protein HMPREF3187_01763 [Aerococcus christensenii]
MLGRAFLKEELGLDEERITELFKRLNSDGLSSKRAKELTEELEETKAKLEESQEQLEQVLRSLKEESDLNNKLKEQVTSLTEQVAQANKENEKIKIECMKKSILFSYKLDPALSKYIRGTTPEEIEKDINKVMTCINS